MFCLSESIAQSDREIQELVEEIKKKTTLAMLILTAIELGRVVAVKVVEEILNERGQVSTNWSQCPKCKTRLESKGKATREIQTLLGRVKWKRRRGGCPNGCKIGQVVPLDKELGIKAYQKTSLEVKWLGCALAIFVPFETASVLLRLTTGLKVSSKSIWLWVQERGQLAMTQLNSQLAELEQGVLPGEETLAEGIKALPLAIGSDGVMAPFRPNAGTAKGKTVWREIKVGVLARLGERVSKTGNRVSCLTQRRLVAVLGNIDAFGSRLWLASVQQGILSSPRVVWLSDGGPGFWRLFDERFAPYAIGILDFYHLTQNLWKGVKAWLDGRTQLSRDWFINARRRLRYGQANQVIADVEAALALQGLPSSAHRSLTNLYNYLDKHRDHIDYSKFKELGLPIGSGIVESACKWLIQQRFKGVGMRWSEDGFNHLLHLRLAWVNGHFDDLFPFDPSPT